MKAAFKESPKMPDRDYDIVIVGGSLGGAAPPLGAARQGASVCLLEETDWRRDFQHTLLDAGGPQILRSDVEVSNPAFKAIHLLGINGSASGCDDMSCRPNNPLIPQDKQDMEASAGQTLDWPPQVLTRGQAALWLAQVLNL